MIDVVYPVGVGSDWYNHELRFSLRSVEKHLKNVRDVYIIGDKPKFLKNVIHIPYEDKHKFKQTRIALKILQACMFNKISDDFLLMNDDHFLLQDYDAEKFPYYYDGLLTDNVKRYHSTKYQKSVLNTISFLKEKKLPLKDFDTHCPIIYNKATFEQMFKAYNAAPEESYVIKSLYCNTNGIKGVEISDNKIHLPDNLSNLQQKIQNKPFFSIDNKAVNTAMKQLLFGFYTEKSRYEE